MIIGPTSGKVTLTKELDREDPAFDECGLINVVIQAKEDPKGELWKEAGNSSPKIAYLFDKLYIKCAFKVFYILLLTSVKLLCFKTMSHKIRD